MQPNKQTLMEAQWAVIWQRVVSEKVKLEWAKADKCVCKRLMELLTWKCQASRACTRVEGLYRFADGLNVDLLSIWAGEVRDVIGFSVSSLVRPRGVERLHLDTSAVIFWKIHCDTKHEANSEYMSIFWSSYSCSSGSDPFLANHLKSCQIPLIFRNLHEEYSIYVLSCQSTCFKQSSIKRVLAPHLSSLSQACRDPSLGRERKYRQPFDT